MIANLIYVMPTLVFLLILLIPSFINKNTKEKENKQMKEIKYKDYRVGSEIFTVKMTYDPDPSWHLCPIVKVDIMKWHTKPTTFFDKLTERLKFSIETYEYDPMWTKLSLSDYIVKKCLKIVEPEIKKCQTRLE